MTNQQNPNTQPPTPPQPPMPQGAPFLPPMPPRPRTWRERMMRRLGMDTAMQISTKGALTIPNWIVGKSIVFFFVSMIACWMVFGYVPGMDLWLVASISVVLFFYGGKSMSKSWAGTKEKRFLRNVFLAGFIIRLLWLLYVWFFFNMDHYGAQYGEMADVTWYMPFAKDLALWLEGESKWKLSEIVYDVHCASIDDTGYPMWLAVGYVIWGGWSDAFIPMLIKCVVSSYCAICIYNIAKRHFGEGTARMAAIFVCLNPNMIYWCGNMFKEAEMVFLCCLAIDNFDRVLSSRQKFTLKNLLPGMLAALALMFFRSALGFVIFLAVFAHIIMASQKVMSLGKKVLAGVLVTLVLAVSIGDRIRMQSQELLKTAQSDQQQVNMEWRAERQGGNSFAKYASAAIFAPLIFTIPFPTFNAALDSQYLQMQLAGGSYIKNILSFFVVLVMLMMLVSGEWRRHVFILAYTLGYLMVLVMSNFAHSGRFHMPVMPLLLLFAAYGIQIGKTNAKIRKWFPIMLVLEVVVCLAWNWFKLKGRGMI